MANAHHIYIGDEMSSSLSWKLYRINMKMCGQQTNKTSNEFASKETKHKTETRSSPSSSSSYACHHQWGQCLIDDKMTRLPSNHSAGHHQSRPMQHPKTRTTSDRCPLFAIIPMLLLILVPFQSRISHCYQFLDVVGPPAANLNELNQHQAFEDVLGTPPVHQQQQQHPFTDTSNVPHQFDWAKRLSAPSSSADNNNNNLLPISDNINNNNNNQLFMTTQRQPVALQPAPRPTILKNLINSTLESIASHQKQLLQDNQQPRLLAAARDLIRTQVVSQHHQQAANLRFMPTTSVGNRLYSFLFPQASISQQFQQQQQQQLLRSSNNIIDQQQQIQQLDQIQSAATSNRINSDSQHQMYNDNDMNNNNKSRSRAEREISLSAPYEQRPRTAALKATGPKAGAILLPSASSGSRTVSSHDRWPQDGQELAEDQHQSLGNESMPMEEGQQQVTANGEASSEGEDNFELSSSSPNEFQWNAMSPMDLDSPTNATDKTTEDFQVNHPSEGEHNQLIATSTSENEPESQQQQQQQQSIDNQEQTNESMENSSDDNQQQQQLMQHLNETEAHDFMANRLNNMTVAMLEPSSSMDEAGNATSFNDDSNSQQDTSSAEALHAVQLPSQYDSVIRAPPEGHYDDYFKPSGGSAALDNLLASNQSMLSSLQDYSLAFAENNSQDNNNNSRGNLTTSPNEAIIDDQSSQHLHHMNLNSSSAMSPVDHQMQYHINRQPPEEQQNSEEFLTPNNYNKTHFADNNHHHHLNDSTQIMSTQSGRRPRKPSASSQSTATTGELTTNAHHFHHHANTGNQSEQQLLDSIQDNQPVRLQQPQQQQQQPFNQSSNSEDNIHVIVANSMSNQRDPNSNEKLINYTSEGRNYTRPGGHKSARNTFVNKDLNELPPGDAMDVSGTSSGSRPGADGDRHLADLPQRLPAINSTSSNEQQASGGEETTPSSSIEQSSNNNDDEDDQLRPSRDSPRHQSKVRLRARARQTKQVGGDQQLPIDRDSGGGGGGGGGGGVHQARPLQWSARKSQQANNNYNNKPSNHNNNPYGSSSSQQLNRQANANHQRQRHNNRHQRHQMTFRRPQVTEAHFNPRELVMQAPTPMPSAVDAIAELPSKVKKLHQQPPGKDELMNELLTALDRVKTAIYKLQPLTAKMNAMYRKSITSNTRDIVMDHHKGTYSKRYPPGDFDDSYDKMHPSELFDRQRRSSSRSSPSSSSARRTNDSNVAGEEEPMETKSSHASPIYLEAPRELLDQLGFAKRTGEVEVKKKANESSQEPQQAPIDAGRPLQLEMPIVAMGVGRRMGDGSVRGKLSLSSPDGGRIVYDDDHHDNKEDQNAIKLSDYYELSGGGQAPVHNIMRRNIDENNSSRPLDDEDVQSPLFGYRITIYQSPAGEGADSVGEVVADTLTGQNNATGASGLSYSLIGSDSNANPTRYEGDDDDEMATSESSVALSSAASAQPSNGTSADRYDLINHGASEDEEEPVEEEPVEVEPVASETSKKEKKEEKEEEKMGKKKGGEERHKQEHKASGEKKGEKSVKHHSKGKKAFEEHKKKKEFKKIKHNKGVMSKESHKLHRDKHVKAHDRGAAKEKALKERTQIEFFEREQIVDDEFEKGKKSTVKAGWASGHDAKKSKYEKGGGGHGEDSMSMGGSHMVKHLDLPGPSSVMIASESGGRGHDEGHSHKQEKGHGHSMETSSGKQSNKFIKKKMESKGKKFKGWREKGYKIITETEFIDRGSLHDSAYKKRDKGAAHHQKFKKHEASSEGHQGAMHEHHKKGHKKEEKKSKKEEKKKQVKEMKEMEGKEKKGKKKQVESKKKKAKAEMDHKDKKEHDHEQEESALTMSSIDPIISSGIANNATRSYNTNNNNHNKHHRHRSSAAGGMLASASTLRPQVMLMPAQVMSQGGPARSRRPLETLSRLLDVDHHHHHHHQIHDEHPKLAAFGMHETSSPNSSQRAMNYTSQVKYYLDDNSGHHQSNSSEISRRSDDVIASKSTTTTTTTTTTSTTTTPKPNNLNGLQQIRASNDTAKMLVSPANGTDTDAKRNRQQEEMRLLADLIKLAKARQMQRSADLAQLKSDRQDKQKLLNLQGMDMRRRPNSVDQQQLHHLVFASQQQFMPEASAPNLFELSASDPGYYRQTNTILPEMMAANPLQFHRHHQHQQQHLPMISSSPFAVPTIGDGDVGGPFMNNNHHDPNLNQQYNYQQQQHQPSFIGQLSMNNRFDMEPETGRTMVNIIPQTHLIPQPNAIQAAAVGSYLSAK